MKLYLIFRSLFIVGHAGSRVLCRFCLACDECREVRHRRCFSGGGGGNGGGGVNNFAFSSVSGKLQVLGSPNLHHACFRVSTPICMHQIMKFLILDAAAAAATILRLAQFLGKYKC